MGASSEGRFHFRIPRAPESRSNVKVTHTTQKHVLHRYANQRPPRGDPAVDSTEAYDVKTGGYRGTERDGKGCGSCRRRTCGAWVMPGGNRPARAFARRLFRRVAQVSSSLDKEGIDRRGVVTDGQRAGRQHLHAKPAARRFTVNPQSSGSTCGAPARQAEIVCRFLDTPPRLGVRGQNVRQGPNRCQGALPRRWWRRPRPEVGTRLSQNGYGANHLTQVQAVPAPGITGAQKRRYGSRFGPVARRPDAMEAAQGQPPSPPRGQRRWDRAGGRKDPSTGGGFRGRPVRGRTTTCRRTWRLLSFAGRLDGLVPVRRPAWPALGAPGVPAGAAVELLDWSRWVCAGGFQAARDESSATGGLLISAF